VSDGQCFGKLVIAWSSDATAYLLPERPLRAFPFPFSFSHAGLRDLVSLPVGTIVGFVFALSGLISVAYEYQ
jgi:hypothetical protein